MGKYINKKIIDNSSILSWGFRMYTKFNFLRYSDKQFMEKAFKKRFHKFLDWEDPKTFQEKLQWLKLNHRNSLQTQCADKIAVRDYVTEKIGAQYLIPQLQILNNANDLVPENLPELPIIIKCNHNSAGYTIVKDKNSINWKKEQLKFRNLLKQNYYYQSREWQYKNIVPKIIIEKLLLDENNDIPFDYKFYCFNGEPESIHVSIKRNNIHYVTFFDLNWKVIPLKYRAYSNKMPVNIPKPKKLNEMIRLSKKLAKDFPFARIDFYHNKDIIYFGEITFHPGSGLEFYMPEYYNKDLGELIDLNFI